MYGLWPVQRREREAGRQLLALGFSRNEIEHRLKVGRLHQVMRGVYSVGRTELSREGRWMAAVLACGEGAFLTHLSAGALFGICEERPGRIEVGVRGRCRTRHDGIRVRERLSLPSQDIGTLRGDLREEIEAYSGPPGVKVLRHLLDRDTFVLSDEELERLFLPFPLGVGSPFPLPKEMVRGFEPGP